MTTTTTHSAADSGLRVLELYSGIGGMHFALKRTFVFDTLVCVGFLYLLLF